MSSISYFITLCQNSGYAPALCPYILLWDITLNSNIESDQKKSIVPGCYQHLQRERVTLQEGQGSIAVLECSLSLTNPSLPMMGKAKRILKEHDCNSVLLKLKFRS